MSEFHVEVIALKNVRRHPNADTLSIADAGGYPVIFRTGEYEEGSPAVYIPVDAVVPDTEEWAFLAGHRRIKAKRLRGVFSMGILAKPRDGMLIGEDVCEAMGVTKYEPPADAVAHGEDETDPGFIPVYTDIEGYRRYQDQNVLVIGEEVVLTEKLHGSNGRFAFRDGRLWAGSHKRFKKPDSNTLWWRLANKLDLATKLAAHEGIAIYGEAFGQVQDLRYGRGAGVIDLALFDALDTVTRRYLDHDDFLALARDLGLPVVPQLYRGPWSTDLCKHAEGKTTVIDADHVREGFVVKPVKERFDERVGRVILKLPGEGYLLRKGG